MEQNKKENETQEKQIQIGDTVQSYTSYVEGVTPKKNLPLQMLKAFVSGGAICVLGQCIVNTGVNMGLEKEAAASWCSVILVFLSALLTGLHLYTGIVKWCGAGALVPITGFANGVAASAMEYRPEGQVFGVGCKIFTIAGPVLLYGILASWGLGLILYLFGMIG